MRRNSYSASFVGFIAGLSLPMFSYGHSAMFPDGFKFDDSNEGKKPKLMLRDVSTKCENGNASGYPCKNIDLQAFLAKEKMGGGSANLNDIWGYTDPVTGAEIAIVGRTNGTSFVDITNPLKPVFLGFLPSHNNGSAAWRDIKTYNDHAFIVADGSGNRTHGLQVFDLTTLRDLPSPGQTLQETAHLDGFGNAHNIAINEDTGYAYIVGSNQCSGGLYMVNVSDPQKPVYAGCFSADGYTHDTQCVVYKGADIQFYQHEICIGYNEDTITIVDVTNKSNPKQISRTPYEGAQYTHQGWFLNDEHNILIMNDELDEQRNGINTTSYIYDVRQLDNPIEIGRYVGPTTAIDHNLYTKDGFVFETNYRAGLRILSTNDIENGKLEEVAYFDSIPGSNSAQFSGTWSNYVYFDSGNIVLSDIGNGLFVVNPDWDVINKPDPNPTYCNSSSTNANYEWIAGVQLGQYSHNSGASQYSDFTQEEVNLVVGKSNIVLQPGYSGIKFNEYWKIWIDLNKDGDFDDTGEMVFSSNEAVSSTVNGVLAIPSSAQEGKTRLRVSMRYNSAPSACSEFKYGEVEDYTVNITHN